MVRDNKVIIFLQIITCDPSTYSMDHPDLIVCRFMENSIRLKRVNSSLSPWEIFMLFCRLLIFFQNQLFRKKKMISGIPSVSNRLDPDQARHNVVPDLGPNCLQKLSADDAMR